MARYSDDKTENLKKLSAYKKEEIIEALGYARDSVYITDSIINYLERKKREDLSVKHHEAMQKEIEAHIALSEWKNEMCVKYGDGNNVKIKDIPEMELSWGAALERAVNEASKNEQRLSKQIDKLYEMES